MGSASAAVEAVRRGGGAEARTEGAHHYGTRCGEGREGCIERFIERLVWWGAKMLAVDWPNRGRMSRWQMSNVGRSGVGVARGSWLVASYYVTTYPAWPWLLDLGLGLRERGGCCCHCYSCCTDDAGCSASSSWRAAAVHNLRRLVGGGGVASAALVAAVVAVVAVVE